MQHRQSSRSAGYCNATGCVLEAVQGHYCRAHWHAVPEDLQVRVLDAAYNRLDPMDLTSAYEAINAEMERR